MDFSVESYYLCFQELISDQNNSVLLLSSLKYSVKNVTYALCLFQEYILGSFPYIAGNDVGYQLLAELISAGLAKELSIVVLKKTVFYRCVRGAYYIISLVILLQHPCLCINLMSEMCIDPRRTLK